MTYLLPQSVLSPRDRWELVGVIHDAGENETSVAFGRWDGDDCVVCRWNGSLNDETYHKGHPISNFQPVWFVLPDFIAQATLKELLMMHARGEQRINHDILLQAIGALSR
jgi:hypothetical protein